MVKSCGYRCGSVCLLFGFGFKEEQLQNRVVTIDLSFTPTFKVGFAFFATLFIFDRPFPWDAK